MSDNIQIGIIDYGASNLNSLKRILKKLKYNFEIISNLKTNKKYNILIIPGMGSSKKAIEKIKNYHILEFINSHIKDNKKIIGICLGYQLFAKNLIEGGTEKGLNLMEGEIINLSNISELHEIKIPIIGWHNIKINKNFHDKKLLEIISGKSYYFAFSYGFFVENKSDIACYNSINKLMIPSLVISNNIIGIQFHPEISGENGIKLLEYLIKY